MRPLLVLVLVAGCGRQDPTPAPGSGAPAMRVISLTPSATEVVAALGATELLVGVDDYSKYPAEVTGLPKVGSFLSPNLETIVGLKPSLVIVDDVHGQVGGALHDAGITTVACAIHALPDVKAALLSVGERLGRTERARRVVAEIDAALEAALARRPGRRPRVLAIIDRQAGAVGGLVAVGPGSWVDELLAVVGGDNVLAASGVRYPKISLEEVLLGKPEVILDLSHDAAASLDAWKDVDVPAVRTGHVIPLSEEFLTAPSPRVKEALDVLAKAIN